MCDSNAPDHVVVRLTIPIHPRSFLGRLRHAPRVWLTVWAQLVGHVWFWQAIDVANHMAYLVIRPIAGWPPWGRRLLQFPRFWWAIFGVARHCMPWKQALQAANRNAWRMLCAPASRKDRSA
jgi:hypothetical protein